MKSLKIILKSIGDWLDKTLGIIDGSEPDWYLKDHELTNSDLWILAIFIGIFFSVWIWAILSY